MDEKTLEKECGWMKDKDTGKLFFFLPATALHDDELLQDCLELLMLLDPDREESEDTIN